MKKFALLLALILAVPLYAHAQALQVNDSAIFQSSAAPFQGQNPPEVNFSASFLFNPSTGLIVPGSLTDTESDPFGFGPFRPAPFDTTFSAATDGTLNFYGNGGTLIQIQVWDTTGDPTTFPAVGNYGGPNTLLICPDGCNGFNGAGYVEGNASLTISEPPAETPEPTTWILLLSGGLLFGLIEFVRRRA